VNLSYLEHAHERLYEMLDDLRERSGGFRYLRDCDGRIPWPQRGVYFFFEDGERRARGDNLRVTRVGTHALTSRSRTTLWNRLAQHRGHVNGTYEGGGNHRGSVFRHHVGEALIARGEWTGPERLTWSDRKSAPAEVRADELELERAVSRYIGGLPFLWVAVDDDAGPESDRGTIEAGSIALLSNHRHPLDRPSSTWLGLDAQRSSIRESGLWNVRHVDDEPTVGFLPVLALHVEAMGELSR
jgi:hypothetical protein